MSLDIGDIYSVEIPASKRRLGRKLGQLGAAQLEELRQHLKALLRLPD